MSSIDELFNKHLPENRAPSLGMSATIANTATANSDEVYVTINNPDGIEHQLGPCPWTPIYNGTGIQRPARGDRALVVFSHEGEPWIVAWTSIF